MKKLYFLVVLVLVSLVTKAQTYHVPCGDLFISEYAEPGTGLSGSKAIEIYNPTPNAINMAGYTLTVYYNQCSTTVDSFKLPPTVINSHDVYVIIGGLTAGLVDPTLALAADTSWGQLIFNGNDAIALFSPTYDTLDIFGAPCTLPNTTAGWILPVTGAGTNDITLVRQPWVLNGERNWNICQNQWDTFAVNNFNHFGWHTMYACGYHPTVVFNALADTVQESVGHYAIPLTLQNPNGDTTYVTVQITGGTTTSGADYNAPVTQTLIFPPYSQLATAYIQNDTIYVNDDNIAEPTESVNYLITSFTNGLSTVDTLNGHHTLYILDNDLVPEFDFQQPTYMAVNENIGTISIPITMNTIPSTPYSVTVSVNTILSTTQPADYNFNTQTITFPAGKQIDTVSFTVVDDCITEGLETTFLQLSNPTNGAILGADSMFIIDINPNDSLPSLLFAASTAYIESAGNISVPVSLTHRYCDTIVVYTNINVGSTATWNVDYNNINQSDSIIFYPGDSTKFINLSIIDDNIQESTESIIIDLSSVNGSIITYYGSATVLIQDNDGPPVYSFKHPLIKSVNETATTYQIAVLANGAVGATPYTVDVDFDAAISTATSGSDFTFTNQTITFNSPIDTQYVAVTIINDCLPENLESINLKLRNAVNGTLGVDSMFTLNIKQNDTIPNAYVLSANTSIIENGGSAFVVVGLNQPYCDTVKVNLNLVNGSALAGSDYNNTNYPTTVVFPPNTIGPFTALIPIIDDAINEPTEAFYFNLSAVSNCNALPYSADSIIIIDNDAPLINPTVQFQNTSGSWIESAGAVQIPITLINPNSNPTSVTATITGGSATLGTDYTATTPATITFPANSSTTQYFNFNIIDDLITESNETFTIVLSNPTNAAQIGANTSFTVTIIDNDVVITPTVQFNNTTYTYHESAGTIFVPVTVTNPNNTDVYFGFTTSGSATLNTDYSITSTSPVQVTATYTNSNIQLNIVDDQLVESTENITLTLNAVSNCNIGSNISCQIFILDNDTTQQPNGINNIVKNDIKVFPNPVAADGTLHLTGIDNNCTIELYNILGQKIFATIPVQQSISLANEKLSGGVYLYKILNKDGLVKEGKLILK